MSCHVRLLIIGQAKSVASLCSSITERCYFKHFSCMLMHDVLLLFFLVLICNSLDGWSVLGDVFHQRLYFFYVLNQGNKAAKEEGKEVWGVGVACSFPWQSLVFQLDSHPTSEVGHLSPKDTPASTPYPLFINPHLSFSVCLPAHAKIIHHANSEQLLKIRLEQNKKNQLPLQNQLNKGKQKVIGYRSSFYQHCWTGQ